MPISHRPKNPKSLRGILAYQAVARQKGALVHIPQSNATNESDVLIGVSSRGRVSGRGRVRVRGISRQRSRSRSSSVSRAEMLIEHRRIVGEIYEDDTNVRPCGEYSNREPNLPALTEGNFFVCISFYLKRYLLLIFTITIFLQIKYLLDTLK